MIFGQLHRNLNEGTYKLSIQGSVDVGCRYWLVQVRYMQVLSDIRKGTDAPTLSAEIVMYCGNVMLTAQNFSLLHFLKLKYNESFTYIMQYLHSNPHLNQMKGIFTNKHLIIAEI